MMTHQAELDFLKLFYKKCNLQILLIDPSGPIDRNIDLGFRESIDRNGEYVMALKNIFWDSSQRVIYRVKDQYLCNFMFLRYEDGEQTMGLCVGPYLTRPITQEEIIAHAATVNLTPEQLSYCYSTLPVLTKDSQIFTALYAFCELLWGTEKCLHFVDINQTLTGSASQAKTSPSPMELETHKQLVELRYSYENSMMRYVAQGNTLKAALWHPSGYLNFLETRSQDPLRNLKNYSIIMNTLLRKGAEQGGVHPIYLDEMSRDYAQKIEECISIAEGKSLMDEMFFAYTQLVSKHAVRNYSTLIRQVLEHIESNLENELTLSILAKEVNLNGNYLSKLFKKETGQSVTDYITVKRITMAMRLLGSTDLQIQEVAQKCGILDMNYFTKKFKKAIGQTPMEYRHALRSKLAKY